MFGGVFKWNSNYWCLSTIKLEQLQVKLTGWTVSKGQEIHNEGTRTNLLWAYDDPGKKTGWQNKVQGLASNVQGTESAVDCRRPPTNCSASKNKTAHVYFSPKKHPQNSLPYAWAWDGVVDYRISTVWKIEISTYTYIVFFKARKKPQIGWKSLKWRCFLHKPPQSGTDEERPGYRGDAVGQVVLAGDAQQLVLRQLEAAEGTRGRLLLQLRRVRPPARKMQPMFKRSKALSAERERGSASRGTHRTIASIFFRYVGLISFRYSGLINMAAKPKAEFFRPARWHSITAEVKMGTTSTHKHNTQHILYTLKPTQIGSHFFFKYFFFSLFF